MVIVIAIVIVIITTESKSPINCFNVLARLFIMQIHSFSHPSIQSAIHSLVRSVDASAAALLYCSLLAAMAGSGSASSGSEVSVLLRPEPLSVPHFACVIIGKVEIIENFTLHWVGGGGGCIDYDDDGNTQNPDPNSSKTKSQSGNWKWSGWFNAH